MQKFNNLYLNIFKNHINIKDSELCDGMDKSSNSYNYNPIIISNLLFQSVIQKDLDPPPIEFLNFICSKISVKKDSVFNISYIQIYQLLKKFNYKNSDAFFNSLNRLKTFKSGNLTIGICSYNINKFYEIFSSEFMDINRIQIFFNNISNGTAGNTFSADSLLRGKFQNVCIYLNKDMIKQYSTWKDTLSHELSHFVQRVVNLDNLNSISNFDKIILNNPITGTQEYSNTFNISIQNIEKIKKILYSLNIDQNIFNNYVMYYLNMLSQTLKISELKTTTQNILNGFQRMYQHQNIVNNKPNYRKIEINHNSEKYLKHD